MIQSGFSPPQAGTQKSRGTLIHNVERIRRAVRARAAATLWLGIFILTIFCIKNSCRPQENEKKVQVPLKRRTYTFFEQLNCYEYII